jgi:GMP synthase (glutamine-hydrolysing)
MKNILIIKCGETYPKIKQSHGDFEDWIINQSNLPKRVFKIYNIVEGERLRHPSDYIGAIITGSHSNINQRLPWIKHLKDWITTARYTNTPVLGICFGHQLMAETLGGKAELNPKGETAGKTEIMLTETGQQDPLYKNIGKSFESYSMHSFHVSQLPPDAELLATRDDNTVESFKVNKLYGVQFHPEFNSEIMKMYKTSENTDKKNKIRAKLKFEFKNESIISNFLNLTLKF